MPLDPQQQQDFESLGAPAQAPVASAQTAPLSEQQQQDFESLGAPSPTGPPPAPTEQPTKFPQTAGEAAQTGWSQLKNALSYIPPVAYTQHALGYETPGAAIVQGMQEAVYGNLKDRLLEWGVGKWHSLTGSGPTADEQRAKDQAYVQHLKSQYPAESIAGQVLSTMTMAYELGAGATALGVGAGAPVGWRIAGAGAQAGLLSGYQGLAQGETWDQRKENAKSGLMWGLITGSALEALFSGAGAAWRWKYGANRGVDAAEHAAESSPWGIELTAGQAGRDPAQQATEQAMREGARGKIPQRLINERLAQQAQAIEQGRTTITPQSGVSNLGEAWQGQVKGAEEAGRNIAGGLYKMSAAEGTSFRPESVARLGQDMLTGLEESGFPATAKLAGLPSATRANNLIQTRLLSSPTAQTLENIDTTRKLIWGIKASDPSDGAALRVIRDVYDDWFSTLATKDMFSGTPLGIQYLNEGRAYAKQYLSLIDESKGLGIIIKDNLGADQVAQWLTNVTNVGGAQKAANLARTYKGIFGANTPEFSALQEGVLNSLTTAAPGKPGVWSLAPEGTTLFTPQRIVNNLTAFTDGAGRVAAQEIFSPEKIEAIRLFTKAVKNVVPIKEFNASGSGYTFWRLFAEKLPLPMFFGGLSAGMASQEQEATFKDYLYHGAIGAALGTLLEVAGPGVWKAHAALRPVAKAVGPSIAAPTVSALTRPAGTVRQMLGRSGGGAVRRALSVATHR